MMPHSPKTFITRFAAVFSICLAAVLGAFCHAAERTPELVSEFEMIFSAVEAVDGIRLVKAEDVPGNVYTEDCGPSQVLEIIRPNQAPIQVGRLTTSCSCLQATMAKRQYGYGERAFIEVRNVLPTVPDGAIYLVFAQLTGPYKATLQHDLYAKSDRNLTKGKNVQSQTPPPSPAPTPTPRQAAPFSAPGYGASGASQGQY